MSKGKLFNLPFGARVGVVGEMHGSATRAIAVTGANAFETNLKAKVIRGAQFEEYFDKVSGVMQKRYIEGTGREVPVKEYFGRNWLQRLVYRLIYRNKTELNLGSGLVTNVGVLALANDPFLAGPSGAPISTLKLANYHVTGTGATAAATTDIKLQAQSTNGGQTPVAGAQSLISAANLQKWQTIATISYTGTEAVTEWGLLCGTIGGAISATTGTPFTAGTAASGTVTATPLTASSSTVQGQQQTIFENTGNATPSWGLVTSNTTAVVTVPAWYKVSDGTAGATPANGNAYTIRPVLWDRKVFSAINVVSGDSIQFTYTCTNTSGG